ncbi:hypothetical protein D3C72_1502660 [compost metagenome]
MANYPGVYIGTAGDGGCIAQLFAYRHHGITNILFQVFLIFRFYCPDLIQGHGGDHRTCPGTEIFCGELFTHYFMNILVQIITPDIMYIIFLINVLEDFIARQLIQLLYNLCQPGISYMFLLVLTRFARVGKYHFITPDLQVLAAQGSEAIALVRFPVILIARAKECRVQQAYHCRQYFLPA